MVTDAQVKRLMRLIQTEETLAIAATKAGMDEKTARKYRDAEQLPSQMKTEHTWRTRPDPFEQVWPGLEQMLGVNDGLEAKTLFEFLQREHPGRFPDGQLRTLQRRIKVWRALEGPSKARPRRSTSRRSTSPGRCASPTSLTCHLSGSRSSVSPSSTWSTTSC